MTEAGSGPTMSRVALPALLAVVVIAIAVSWLHPPIAFSGQIYASPDAQAASAFQSLGDGSDGEFPHWNPFVFAGMPSYASLAYNPGTYPLTEPVRVLRDALGLPPMFWMLLHLALAGLATTGWSRWRGQSWGVSIAAGCWVVALPKLAAWGAHGHGTKLGTFAWLPLAAWCADAVLRRGGVGWASGLALAVGMMLLRAHVQIAYYAVLLVGILVLAAWLDEGRDPARRAVLLRRTGLVVAAGLVGLAVSLVLYLPVLEYQSHSVRGAAGTGGGAAWDYATNWSLSWPELATLWWPTAAGYGGGAYAGQMPFTDYPHYIGMPILLLALAGAVTRRDRLGWSLVAVVVLTTLLALGHNAFVYRIFYEVLPGFRKFRVPVMILALQNLALILLAARGLEELMVRRRGQLARPLLVALLATGALGLLCGTVGAGWLRESTVSHLLGMAQSFGRPAPPAPLLANVAEIAVADALRLGALFLAGGLVFFGVARGRVPSTVGVALVALLVFLDLWRVDQPLLRPEAHLVDLARTERGVQAVPAPALLADADALEVYTEDSALARFLKEQEARPRVMPLGPLFSDNRLAAQGLVSLGGYHAAKLKVYEDVRARMTDGQRPRFELARLFGAHWVVSTGPLSAEAVRQIAALGLPVRPEPVYEGPDGVVHAVADPLPRAWVVGDFSLERPGADTTGEEPDGEVLERVLGAGFDPARTVLLSAKPDPVPEPAAEGASVEVLREGYNSWALRVDLPAPGVLVTPDPWYPGWEVRVDGERRDLLRANYAQRAVALPAGAHEVIFHYRADAWVRGRRIATAGWILVFAGFVAPAWRRWRHKPASTGESR